MAQPRTVNDLVRYWWLLAAVMLAGMLVGGIYALVAPSTYTAQAYVLVTQAPRSGADTFAFAHAYARLVDQPQVLGVAAGQLGVPAGSLAGRVQGQASANAPVIEVSASAGTAPAAAATANTVAEVLIDFGNGRSVPTGVQLSMFSSAGPPAAPTSPNLALDLLVGAATGLLLGGLAVLSGVGDLLVARIRERRRRRTRPAGRGPPAEQPTTRFPVDGNGHRKGHREQDAPTGGARRDGDP